VSAPAARIARYGRAWETGDEHEVADLFAVDAVYRSQIFRDPHVGRDAIRTYWRRGAATQRDVSVRFGRPVVDGRRVAVEWWTTTVDPDDGEITLPGCLLLRSDGEGRCEELREYWHVEPGLREPPQGWGT
jgi:ketosteroid isomerase-like protein